MRSERWGLLRHILAIGVLAATGLMVTPNIHSVVGPPSGSADRGLALASVAPARSPRRAALAAAGYEERGRQALALISYPWEERLPGWQVQFLGPRAGYLAMTYNREKRIEVYLRADRPVGGIAHDLAHELGHAVDVTFNSTADRAEYLELRGIKTTTPWWVCDGCTDLSVGAGDFAESFALWAAPAFRFYSALGSVPTEDDISRLAHLFDRGAQIEV